MTATVDAIEVRNQIVTLVRDFVRREVEPIAQEYDNEDIYPQQLIEPMREMGLFGITIPEEYGGLGLDHTTFATIFEELSRGWMSVSGIIGTHHVLAHIITNFGTDHQKEEYLPRLASGALRGGLALTEPDAGSDVQGGKTTARKDGEEYVINGTKMFITNAEYGNVFAVMTKTDPEAQPRHRGMSCFVVEKPNPGIRVGQHLDKLGYRGLDSSELIFDNCRVGSETLVGGVEGPGVQAGHGRTRNRTHQCGREGRRSGDRRIRRRHQVRAAARGVRQAHSPAPGDSDQAGRNGDQDSGGPAADL